MAARFQALRVSRGACPTDVGSQRVDGARRRFSDDPDQGSAARAVAAHATPALVEEIARNARAVGVAFERKARPLGRIGAARAAALAVEHVLRIVLRFDTLDGRRRRWKTSRPRGGGLRSPLDRGPHGLAGAHAAWMLPTAILPVRRSSWVSKETFWPSTRPCMPARS